MIKNKNKNAGRDLALLLGGAAVVFTPLVVTSCDDKPKDDPKPGNLLPCVCPAEHLPGDNSCCNQDNKTCTNVPGTTSENGIPITNRLKFADITQRVDDINWAIGALAAAGYSADTLKKNVKEITLVDSNIVTYDVAAGIVYVGMNIPAEGRIRTAFVAYLDEVTLLAMFKQFDNSKDNIRLAFVYNGNRLSNCLVCNCA
ncbi:MAG: hypothetical protein FWC01_10135 [Treponema sp.]|nr:hypothetical protein [Treponema sp.]